jgi:PEP-CTERM motif
MRLRNWSHRRKSLLPVLAAMVLLPILASATPVVGSIIGTFGFSGPGVLTFSTAPGNDFIRFCTKADSSCAAAPTGTGDFGVSGPGFGNFNLLLGTDTGAILNTSDHTPPLSPYTYLPPGAAVTVDNYIALTSANALANYNLDFQADMLPVVACTTTSTQQCVGPFELSANGPNVSVTMDVLGTIINKQDGSKSNMDITITGQYNATTIGAVIAGAQSASGAFSNSWAATVNATAIPVPEPGTATTTLLLGMGMVTFGLIRRKKSRP